MIVYIFGMLPIMSVDIEGSISLYQNFDSRLNFLFQTLKNFLSLNQFREYVKHI